MRELKKKERPPIEINTINEDEELQYSQLDNILNEMGLMLPESEDKENNQENSRNSNIKIIFTNENEYEEDALTVSAPRSQINSTSSNTDTISNEILSESNTEYNSHSNLDSKKEDSSTSFEFLQDFDIGTPEKIEKRGLKRKDMSQESSQFTPNKSRKTSEESFPIQSNETDNIDLEKDKSEDIVENVQENDMNIFDDLQEPEIKKSNFTFF